MDWGKVDRWICATGGPGHLVCFRFLFLLLFGWLFACEERSFLLVLEKFIENGGIGFGDESSGGLVDWCVVYILLLL